MDGLQKVFEYLSVDNRFQVFADFLGQERRIVREYYKRMQEADDLKKKDWSALFLCFDVTPETFGIENDFSSILGTKNFGVLQNECMSKLKLTEQSRLENTSYSQVYYSDLQKKLCSANKSIIKYRHFVNDALFKPDKEDTFFKGYDAYMRAFEKCLLEKAKKATAEKPFSYKRIMALPVSVFSNKPTTQGEIMHEFLMRLFHTSFVHCWKMLSDDFKDIAELYVLASPIRAHNLFLIDDSTIITEIFKIRPDGLAIPDLIWTDFVRPNMNSSHKRNVYQTDFEEVTKDTNRNYAFRVTKQMFKSSMLSLGEKLQEDSNRHIYYRHQKIISERIKLVQGL